MFSIWFIIVKAALRKNGSISAITDAGVSTKDFDDSLPVIIAALSNKPLQTIQESITVKRHGTSYILDVMKLCRKVSWASFIFFL